MFTNLPQHDKFIAYCRQLLPSVRITQLRTLSLVVIGLLESTDAHLSSLAEVIPLNFTDLSIEQRVRRWLKNPHIDVQHWYEPFVRTALLQYRPQTIYVVMDTSQFGPSCRALVVGVAYGGQVLPLGWRVVKGQKGHTDPQLQNELLREIRAYLPPGQVVLVADSEFSAVDMLTPIREWGWFFIVRVRSNIAVQVADGSSFILNQAGLQKGQTKCWQRILWTAKHTFGPLMLVATWQTGEQDPLYVITNTNNMPAALLVYSWRFWIEPLFADFKGRGFHLAHTHIRDPKRLARLLMAACIAFLWSLATGSFVFHTPKQRLVDRNDRDDRSFFQLGYRIIKRCLKLHLLADILFTINPIWLPHDLTIQPDR
jgi:hypothetical protein